jgi:hypothetical protein
MSTPDGRIGDHPLDDLAAYALHALDDAERDAVDDHLSRCLACREDLAAHHETLAQLAPVEAPPAAVWQRIAASIGAPGLPDPHAANQDEQPSAPAPGSDDVVRPLRPAAPAARVRERQPLRVGWIAAAACLAVALAMGGVAGFALGSSGDDSADIGTLAEQAADRPDGELATLVSADGDPVARVVADDDGAYLVLDGLENLPEGRAYQLWSVTGSQPVSLGMLGRDGTNTVAFRLPPTITALAISEAPTTGDVTPAAPFLASGPVTPT